MTKHLVWISGASRGIGAALAASVPFTDAHTYDLSRSGGSPHAEHVPADLADPSAWQAVEAHFRAVLGGFEGDRAIFVHNAGTLHPMGFAGRVNSAAYATNVLLNSAAPQVLGHAFLAAVGERGVPADLVLLTSGAASSVYEGWSSYCAGKAAVDHWVRNVGAEQARLEVGARVLALAPGVVATAMQEQIRATDPEDFPAVDKFIGLHERGELRDPADAARDIWEVVGDHTVTTGTVLDLRRR